MRLNLDNISNGCHIGAKSPQSNCKLLPVVLSVVPVEGDMTALSRNTEWFSLWD